MKKNQEGIFPNKRRGPTINGLKLDVQSTETEHAGEGKRFYPSDEAIVHRLHENLAKIMTLSHDVFVTSLDLALLDQSHGVLGGEAKHNFRDENQAILAAKQEIDDALQGMRPLLPFLDLDGDVAHFLPSLTMFVSARVKLGQLSHLGKTEIALKTKRVFVDGEAFYGYSGSGLQIPDDDFWISVFNYYGSVVWPGSKVPDAAIDAVNTVKLCPCAAFAFWLERCIHRDLGQTRLMDQLNLRKLCAGREETLIAPLEAIMSEFGWCLPSNLYALKYFGAAANPPS